LPSFLAVLDIALLLPQPLRDLSQAAPVDKRKELVEYFKASRRCRP